MNWIGSAPAVPGEYDIKLRHGPARHQGFVTDSGDGEYHIRLKDHDQGIAPGQVAVLYADDRCLGAGFIRA